MSYSTIIKIDRITKQYRLGQIGGTTLRDELQRFSAKLHHREDPTKRIGARECQTGETFLALDDVSFEVKSGERVGIIGRNGAGKSTLLKLISRVTAPTSGWIGLNGRVASMLEVGTGFHGELTGRENIYMNGAILGMTRREIDSKLEEIIDFSECRSFIDTPVKRYSSGMYVKLAFSVAAHLNSEIIIMDEVLAVGDAAFQKKCLDKMSDVSRSDGRTVLYVSHNMNTIRTLCDRCIVLDHGRVICDDGVSEGIDAYMRMAFENASTRSDLSIRRRGYEALGSAVKLMFLELKDKKHPCYQFREHMFLSLRLHCFQDTNDICVRLEILSSDGTPIGTAMAERILSMKKNETRLCSFKIDLSNIVPGHYHTVITVYQKNQYSATVDLDYVTDAFSFEIIDQDHAMPLVWNRAKWGSVLLKDMELVEASEAVMEEDTPV